MKSIFFVACIAAALAAPEADAKADADPYLAYGYAPRVYSGYNGYYNGYRAYSGYPAYGYRAAYRGLWKREAEAEPEADPAYLTYGYNYPAVTYAHSVAHPVATYAHSVAAPVAAYSYPAYGYRTAYHGLWKREAEAEPEADPAYLTYGYNYPVTTYAHSVA